MTAREHLELLVRLTHAPELEAAETLRAYHTNGHPETRAAWQVMHKFIARSISKSQETIVFDIIPAGDLIIAIADESPIPAIREALEAFRRGEP